MPQTMNRFETPVFLGRQLLDWVAAAPRTHAEAMEAWGTHCPLLSIWEDALADGLVRVRSTGGRLGTAAVDLTPAGEARRHRGET